jgi:hypothetical protein
MFDACVPSPQSAITQSVLRVATHSCDRAARMAVTRQAEPLHRPAAANWVTALCEPLYQFLPTRQQGSRLLSTMAVAA